MIFREYINDNYKSFCTGCGACVQKCTKKALTLIEDDLGYYVAHFDKNLCCNCGLCEGTCPSLFDLQIKDRRKEPPLYAVQMKDEMRSLSSSGGAFSELALLILGRGGVVFGAVWDSDFSVKHVWVDNADDLGKLRGSKYIQSYVGETFKECKAFLKQDRTVLFSGTPCQIAGLYAFLGKDYEKLYTVDVLCFHAPSHKYFQCYLNENYKIKNIYSCNMRDKSQGWFSTNLVFKSKDIHGKENIIIRRENDVWERAFVDHLMMSEHCDNCKYVTRQRVGDLTLGDFWEICHIDKSFDNLGTNSVLVNSKKGEELFSLMKERAAKMKKRKLDDIKGNRIAKHSRSGRHKQSERFERMFLRHGYNLSAQACLDDKHDVCVLGCWEVRNYGSHLTYFALYHFLKELGKSVIFVGCPGDAGYKTKGLPEYFKEMPYEPWEMHPQYKDKIDMRKANSLSDTFIVGSDQLWFPQLYRYFGSFAYLDFIHSNKRKIAYATSFGTSDWEGTSLEQSKISYLLSRFSDISVRELSGIEVCEKYFDRDVKCNLDPVFLCDVAEYDKLADKSTFETREDYLLAYILDCTNKKAELLMALGKELGTKVLIITDPNITHNLSPDYPIVRNVYVEDWLKLIRDSKYVATDSFHGMCVSIIYRKNFVAFRNVKRGSARFDDYGNILHIHDRIIKGVWNVSELVRCYKNFNTLLIDQILSKEIPISKNWLKDAIQKPLQYTNLSDFDMAGILNDESIIRQREKAEERKLKNRAKAIVKKSFAYKIIKKIKQKVYEISFV